MIKAILFDLDNTLVDFWKMKMMSIEAAISAMIDSGLKMSRASARRKLIHIYDNVGYEYRYIFEKFLKQETGKVDWKILANAIVAYRKVREGFLEPYPGVFDTLLSLRERGIKLGIVTDAPRLNAWVRLASMRIDDFFDIVVCFEDTKQQKPGKLPFEKALKNLGIKPEEAIMVGDNPGRDIMGARKLGIRTCFAHYGRRKKFLKGNVSRADFVLAKFSGLLRIIEKN